MRRLLILVVVPLSVVACGGSDSKGTSPGTSPTTTSAEPQQQGYVGAGPNIQLFAVPVARAVRTDTGVRV